MKTPQAAPADAPTQPRAVPEGRGQVLSRASAQAIADASKAAGFPVPPQAAQVLASPDPQPTTTQEP